MIVDASSWNMPTDSLERSCARLHICLKVFAENILEITLGASIKVVLVLRLSMLIVAQDDEAALI